MAEMESGGGKFGARIWEAQCFLSHALLCMGLEEEEKQVGKLFIFFSFPKSL